MAIEAKPSRALDLAPWVEALEADHEPYGGWRADRAAFALAGSGSKAALGPLARFCMSKSRTREWRADRWSELPALLTKPLPERLAAFWRLFPMEPSVLALAEPTTDEMRRILAGLIDTTQNEDRQFIPMGGACLVACAAMATKMGLALPDFETRWWLEQFLWGNAPVPTTASAQGALVAIVPASAHPALVRDMLTASFSRVSLRQDLLALDSPGYRNIGTGWLLLADIDKFKHVNDQNGFLTGDSVLANIADRLRRVVGDVVVRYAGEQFLVAWSGDDAVEVAEELRASIEAKTFDHAHEGEPVKATISVGVAAFEDLTAGIEAAKGALARAKQNGRNCVST